MRDPEITVLMLSLDCTHSSASTLNQFCISVGNIGIAIQEPDGENLLNNIFLSIQKPAINTTGKHCSNA